MLLVTCSLLMSHPLISKVITWFFSALGNQNISYAVLRKAELIPENIGNDIDILIQENERTAVLAIINNCAEKFGFKVYERQDVKGLYAILYTFVDGELIFFRLDFTNPVKNPNQLLPQRLQNKKGIYYLPSGLYEKKKKNRIENLLTYPWRFLFPSGTFVVIVGPDGVGKSTTAELVAQLLETFHIPVVHKHLGFRPKILPTKAGLLGKQPVAGQKSATPGLLRFLYYTLDHTLGYFFRTRPLLIKGKFVLGERYYLNFLVDPRPKKELGFPCWLPRFFYFFLPKPDIVILLSHDPKIIYQRRQEHSVEEIERQMSAYRELGMQSKKFLEIRTDKSPVDTARELTNLLIPKKYTVAVIASHPIQYQSPLWRKIAENPQIDLIVYYCVNWGVNKPQFDPKFFGRPYQWDIPLLEGYKYKFLRNYSPKPKPKLGGFMNPGVFLELWKNKYDAVLIMGWMDVTFWFAFLAAKIKNIPVLLRVVNSSNYDRHVKRSNILLFFKRIYLTALFRFFVSGFLAIGSWNKEMYLKYGVPEKRIFHFPYAVWNEFFMNELQKYTDNGEEIRNELGIGPKTKVITYAARFVEEKHPEYIIRAYGKIKNLPDTMLLMIGDGPMRKSLEEETKEKQLNNVKFLGFKNQTELVKIYAVTDIFVRADDYIKGDWGATVNEAMACGLPIVAPDTIGAQADLIREGENGFVYHLGDIDVLSEYIKKLVLDEKLLESMKKKSKEIISKWSYKEDVEGLLSALKFYGNMLH